MSHPDSLTVSGHSVALVLQDLEVAAPKCTVDQDCGSPAAGVYLMTFILLTTFIMTNLVSLQSLQCSLQHSSTVLSLLSAVLSLLSTALCCALYSTASAL